MFKNIEAVWDIDNEMSFNNVAVKIFRFQAQHIAPYQKFLQLLNFDPHSVSHYTQIPHLPVEAFKSHLLFPSSRSEPKTIFTSSGTTATGNSRHYVDDIQVYEQSFVRGFERIYGNIKNFAILGLLPGYLERPDASLTYMVEQLIKLTRNKHSGFYLYNHNDLNNKLQVLEKNGQKTLLIGVSFALLDFMENHPQQLNNTIVMETGGMKGRRREMVKEELHDLLKKGYGVENIHSEYGMTELLSQAYSTGGNLFTAPPWMKISIRDIYDPFSRLPHEKTGGINIIDLANVYSCSFLSTKDLGKTFPDGSFEVLGRFDHSDIRGCNLMVE